MKKELKEWEIQHWKYVFEELNQGNIPLIKEKIPQIIEYMSFKNRSKREPLKCSLYQTGKSCHPSVKDLNCLLCACPNYDSSREEGGCKIKSKKGYVYTSLNNSEIKVWDCSNCNRYHSPLEVETYLKRILK